MRGSCIHVRNLVTQVRCGTRPEGMTHYFVRQVGSMRTLATSGTRGTEGTSTSVAAAMGILVAGGVLVSTADSRAWSSAVIAVRVNSGIGSVGNAAVMGAVGTLGGG